MMNFLPDGPIIKFIYVLCHLLDLIEDLYATAVDYYFPGIYIKTEQMGVA